MPSIVLRADPAEITGAIRTLFQSGDVIELRIPKTRQGVISGYFDNPAKLVDAATRLNGAGPGVYITLNPVSPALLARAANRAKEYAKTTTSDHDIDRRRWLPIDCDPVRPAEISSTDGEHEAALEKAREIRADLTEHGWPAPVLADSGNGAHLLYRIELPNDEDSAKLIEQALKALAARFNTPAVKVDETVFNAARIMKLYGTVSRKGDDIDERPHRLSRIVDMPGAMEPVTRELLQELATKHTPAPPPPPGKTWARKFNLEGFIAQYLKAREPVAHEGGRKWVLEECPFNADHKAPDAAVFQATDGSIGFHCFRNSCAEKTWGEVRAMFSPRDIPACPTPGPPEWPEPSPLGCELPPVRSFSISLLPEVLRDPVEDIAERMQVPVDYPAACCVVVLAGAVNRRARIQPKRQDFSWREVPNLWGGVIAQPGYLKSPVFKVATRELCMIESLWREQYAAEVEQYEIDKEAADLRLATWKEQSKAALKSGKTAPLRPDISLRPPTQRRLIIGDSTFEKTHELMAENPAGLLILRDELVGWLTQLERQGREGERAFSLEAWNGDSSFTVDRIGRGSIHVPACCLSMLGGITPGRLRNYLNAALCDGPGNDGLIQRFQILVWPDAPAKWTYVDRAPKPNRIGNMLERLTALDAEAPVLYSFDDQAQALFIEWLSGLEGRIRNNTLHPALVSHLSKLRKTMPALAVLFALADGFDPPVGKGHAAQAIGWCDYLESHAHRIYSCVVSARMQAAATLAERLRDRTIGADGTFARRDVYRRHWTGLETPEEAGDALGILQDAGWVRPKPAEPGMGRPADLWVVNPRVYKI